MPRSAHTSPSLAADGRPRRSTWSIGPGLNHRSRSTGRPSGPRALAISLSREYPHSFSNPINSPKRSQSPSSCSAPSVTYQVNDESGVNNLTCTIGVGHDSCEYSGGRVFLNSTGSSSMGSFSFVERSPPEMEASVPFVLGSISEQRELTVRFDDEGPSSRRILFEPCPKNQGRSRSIDCGHFVEWSGDQFLPDLLLDRR